MEVHIVVISLVFPITSVMSKHGIWSSKTSGSEAGDVPLNRTVLRPYDSGSESDSESVSESEYESDSNSNANEGFTSRHSCITDELNLPITSLKQYPPVQVMERHGDHDFFQTPVHDLFRTPESSLNSSPTGSTDSGESLFSLQINRNSFTNSFAKGGAKNTNIFIGKTKNFHGHEELGVAVSEGLSPTEIPIPHQTDFVLPLTFPKTKENNTNENKKKKEKNKKKKKKKKKEENGACLSCFPCMWPTCSLKCLNCSCWPNCSSCLSCSGCCECPSWKSCCCQLPSCNCKCFSWPSCHWKCPSWSCCCK
ncbi:hypothetical protein LIER_18310 [Lithospermum erythrorhizon]|uniref:Uncharacterized protein n=1 Tax=Lithospermum erythrorhizon TaxID=34254 RepID=A0AAV3QHZ7_LITER